MCHIKNLQQTTQQDFDSWFEALKDDIKVKTDLDSELNFEQLLAPLPTYPPVEYIVESPMQFPSVVSYPSPTSSGSENSYTPTLCQKREAEVDQGLHRKRQRQNEAAKRCRLKKLNQLQESQEMVKRFEQERFDMSVKLAILEKEKISWLQKEKEMEARIRLLKSQLDESHMILMKGSK
jgi:hypothetical protein